MPRLDLLQQELRMDVRSPVPIRGAAEARLSGEAVERFGNQVSEYANQLIKIDAIKQKDQADQTSAQFKAMGEIAGKNALTYAAKNYQDPDGKDQIPKAQEFYNSVMQPHIDAIEDPNLKATAQYAADNQWNARGHDLFSLGAETKAANAKVSDQQLWGTQIQQITQDPAQWKQVLTERNNYLDSAANFTYTPAQKAKEKELNAKEASMTAIETYMQSGDGKIPDFKTARMVLNEASPYIVNQAEELKRINDAEYSYKNRVIADSNRVQREQEKNQKNIQTLNYSNFQVAVLSTNDPVKKESLLSQARDLIPGNGLTANQLKTLNSTANSSNAFVRNPTNEAQAKQLYLQQIRTGLYNGTGESIAANTYLQPQDKVDLLQQLTATHARELKKSGDPGFGRNLDAGAKALDSVNASRSSGVDPVTKSNDYYRMQMDYYNSVDKGIDPKQAAQAVVVDHYTKIKNTEFIPQSILPASAQMNSADLQKSMPYVKQQIEALEQQGKSGVKKAKEITGSLIERMNALKYLEGRNNGR